MLELRKVQRVYPPSFPTGFTESPDLVLLVEAALQQDATTKEAALDIIARGGTIVLMGRVDTEEVKAAAERQARSVPGVTEVDNQIQAMI